MSQFRGISVVTEPAPQSGEKYRTSEGFSAIKNGMKARPGVAEPVRGGKPPWLRARVPGGGRYGELRGVRHGHAHADGQRVHPRLPLLRRGHR